MPRKTTTIPVGKGALVVLGAIWTLVSGTAGALLKDEVRDRIAPVEASATVSTPRLQPGIRFADYLEGVGETDPKLSSAQKRMLDEKGMIVFARVTTKGFKAERLRVRGAVLTEEGEELGELTPLQWGFVYKPAANTDSTVANIWLPRPVQHGRYKAVVRVYEDFNFAPIRADKESKVFVVPRSP